jgi:hypothetical protein
MKIALRSKSAQRRELKLRANFVNRSFVWLSVGQEDFHFESLL